MSSDDLRSLWEKRLAEQQISRQSIAAWCKEQSIKDHQFYYWRKKLSWDHRKRDKLKILQWDHNGFWLHYRRLERGKFNWPTEKNDVVSVSYRELRWLLDGLALKQNQAHQAVKQRIIL